MRVLCCRSRKQRTDGGCNKENEQRKGTKKKKRTRKCEPSVAEAGSRGLMDDTTRKTKGAEGRRLRDDKTRKMK